jgi:hypothetical protein
MHAFGCYKLFMTMDGKETTKKLKQRKNNTEAGQVKNLEQPIPTSY